MNIGCIISQFTLDSDDNFVVGTAEKYKELAHCALNSFKKFHPDVTIHYINDSNIDEYYSKYFKSYDLVNHIGIVRYMLAYDIMLHHKYDKIIVLGCDTITCARMNEFIDDNIHDVLTTLNYPCQESTEYWTTPIIEVAPKIYDHGNINADVVCFNNSNALKKVVDLSIEHFTVYAEQGALNELAWIDKSYSVKIVDFPYPLSSVVYNARSKGVFGTDMIKKGLLAKHGPLDGQPSPIMKWYVKDKKLYTEDNKQIKCFHFVEGLTGRSMESFNEIINDFKYNWFNKDTITFFKEECGCVEFFS